MPLQPQDGVEEEGKDEAEDEYRQAVLLPRLLTFRAVTDEPVEATLDAAEEAEPAAPEEVVVLVDARHVEAERIGRRDQDDHEEDDLEDALAHLEPLPTEQRVDEVHQDGEGRREPEDVGGRHQTRPSTQSRTKTAANATRSTAEAARSYISQGPPTW